MSDQDTNNSAPGDGEADDAPQPYFEPKHETDPNASEVLEADEILAPEVSDETAATGELAQYVSRDPEAEDLGMGEVAEDALRQRALARLKKASTAEARVKVMATIADTYGIETLIGLFMPGVGDAGTSLAAFTYLFVESIKSELSWKSRGKIALYQAADFAIGFTPLVGDLLDFLFRANLMSHKEFEARVAEIADEARVAGATEEEVEEILAASEKLSEGILSRINVFKAKKQIQSGKPETKGLPEPR